MRRRIIHHHKHKKKKKIRKKKNKIKPRIFQYHDNKPTIVEIPKTEVRSHFLKPIVNLGCLNSNVYIQDIVPININWPQYQNPDNFATGSQGPTYALKEGNIVNLNTSQPNSGQPTSNKYSTPTPLQSSVQLTSNVNLYNGSFDRTTPYDEDIDHQFTVQARCFWPNLCGALYAVLGISFCMILNM